MQSLNPEQRIDNLQEVGMVKVAAKKALDPQVKTFAQQMIADHGQAQTQLM